MSGKPHHLALLLCMASTVHAAGPGRANDFGGRRVLIIGIDGLLPTALRAAENQNLGALMAAGTTTFTATSGGRLQTPTQQPTLSGPGWTSMMTGVYADKHGVTGNTKAPSDTLGGYQLSQAPHFAKHLKEAAATSSFSSIVSWGWIEDHLVAAQPACFDFHTKGVGKDYASLDRDVKEKTLAHLSSADPDVLFVHFDQVDGAGHHTGFRLDNPEYMKALLTVDGYVGEISAALKKRPRYQEEDWLVIVSTDHGGTTGGAHGGQSPEERTIFIILSGGNAEKGRIEENPVGLHVIPALAFRHLGIPVNPAWAWEPGSLGR